MSHDVVIIMNNIFWLIEINLNVHNLINYCYFELLFFCIFLFVFIYCLCNVIKEYLLFCKVSNVLILNEWNYYLFIFLFVFFYCSCNVVMMLCCIYRMDLMQSWGLLLVILLVITSSVWSSSWWLEGTDNWGIRCVTTFHHVCYTLPAPYRLKKWYYYIIFLLNWNVLCWSWLWICWI